jgi:hypothetical protein
MTFSIMKLTTKSLLVTLSLNNIQHKTAVSVIMQNFIVLIVIIVNVMVPQVKTGNLYTYK